MDHSSIIMAHIGILGLILSLIWVFIPLKGSSHSESDRRDLVSRYNHLEVLGVKEVKPFIPPATTVESTSRFEMISQDIDEPNL